MQKNDTCFNFALTEHIKQDKPGKVFGNVRLYKYPVRELCVYEILDSCLRPTEKLRNSSKLLVSYIKPYKAVTSTTIGRWFKTLLRVLIQKYFLFTALGVLQRVKLLRQFPLM